MNANRTTNKVEQRDDAADRERKKMKNRDRRGDRDSVRRGQRKRELIGGEGGLGIAGSSAGYVRLAGRAVGQQLPKWSGKQYPCAELRAAAVAATAPAPATALAEHRERATVATATAVAGSFIRRSVGRSTDPSTGWSTSQPYSIGSGLLSFPP